MRMWPFDSQHTASPDLASIRATFDPPAHPSPANLVPPASHPTVPASALDNPSSADKCPVDPATRSLWLKASSRGNNGANPLTGGGENAEAGPSKVKSGSPPGRSISTGSFGASARRQGQERPDANKDVGAGASADECPVDHKTRSRWLEQAATASEDIGPSGARGFAALASTTSQDSSSNMSLNSDPRSQPPDATANIPKLSTSRVTSSIPRGTGSTAFTSPDPSATPLPNPTPEEKWVYPSEQQFFLAMLRKNHNPSAEDMSTIVPIHNAVNERTWREVLKWEEGKGGEKCGGVRLVSFKGRPGDRSPRAWMNVVLGYTAPFDRHDWVISRCGTEIRYVIDFYTGRAPEASSPGVSGSDGLPPRDAGNLSFYLDVRPALDGWEGARMRVGRLFGL